MHLAGYGLLLKPLWRANGYEPTSKILLSVEQTGFIDQFYCFGSTAVQKKKINGKPNVTAVEEFMCSDGILYREGVSYD